MSNVRWGVALGVSVNSDGFVRNSQTNVPYLPKIHAGQRKISIKGKKIPVHLLIALAFLGQPPSSKHTVDHINRDKTDNRLVNLRWATKKEQVANRDSICKRSHALNNKVRCRKLGSLSWSDPFPSMTIAAEALSVDQGSISKCVSGKQKSARGYEFERVTEELPGENWKVINGISVSDAGRTRHSSAPPYFPKIAKGMQYAFVKDMLFHVLVCKAFNGPPPSPLYQVDHINRCRWDNRASNLRWATREEQRENQERKTAALHVRRVQGRLIGDSEWTMFDSRMDAERITGALSQNIAKCCSGSRACAGAWEWANVG